MTRSPVSRHARSLMVGGVDDGRRARSPEPDRSARSLDLAAARRTETTIGERGETPIRAMPMTRRGGGTEFPIDAQTVISRLEEAGRSLLALPHSGPSTRMRLNATTFARALLADGEDGDGEALNRQSDRARAAHPDSTQITRMDEALAWIPLIPRDRYVLRRVVGCRALVHPLTDRHLYPWRRIGTLIGADHKAVQRWHAQGIDLIVAVLNT